MDLLGSDSSSEEEAVSFKINENYAKNYEKWRKKEERQKLIDRYGDAEDTSSSSEEEEIRSTPQMDKDWLRAYAVVRFKQPRLYKKGEKFFNEQAKPVIKKKEKATTLKDHERKFLLEKGGIESDEDSKPAQHQGMSYYEEQEEIKKSLKDALGDSDDDDNSDENGSGLLTKKHKTQEEKQQEENEYLEWLKGEREELEDKEAEAELAPLKAYWNDPTLNEKERTLRDYILNNGYMDQEESDDSDDEEDSAPMLPDFTAEEEFLEKAEVYEHKYNFRHEEPGGDEIKSYPRVIETSVRTKDTRRAEKRQRKMERKKTLKEQRKEDIRLLQKLQKEEKNEKLGRLKQIAKNPQLDYDLDADFDPEEHNKIMQKYFNDDYYGNVQDTGEKPKFDFDAAIDDDEDDWWQNRLKEADEDDGGDDEESDKVINSTQDPDNEEYEDDQNFIMDADYDPSQDYKAEKKRKKKYGKTLAKKLPVFDPTTKTFDEYMAEYLDDKIDTLPFTYRDVPSNDFGLSTEEILQAQEKELNTWVSVKKMSQYRSSQEEESEKRRFASRARLEEKKHKILPSLFTKPEDEDTQKKRKKKKKKNKNAAGMENSLGEDMQPAALTESTDSHAANEEKLHDSSSSGVKVKRKRQNSEEINTKNKKKRKVCETNHSNVSDGVFNTASSVAGAEKGKKKKGLKLSDENLGSKASVKKGLLAPGKEENVQALNEERVGSKTTDVNRDTGIKRKKKKQKSEVSADSSCIGLTPKQSEKEPTLPKESVNGKQAMKLGVNKKTDQDAETEKVLNKMQRQMSGKRMEDNKQDQLKSGKRKMKEKKKNKKKKVSISNFSSKAIDSGKSAKTLNSKELERKLSQVMSASRLSKFGLGPNALKRNKNSKKKQKKKETQMT